MHPDIRLKEIALILYIGKRHAEPIVFRDELIGTAKELLELGGLIESEYNKPSGIEYYKLTDKGCAVYDHLKNQLSELEIKLE